MKELKTVKDFGKTTNLLFFSIYVIFGAFFNGFLILIYHIKVKGLSLNLFLIIAGLYVIASIPAWLLAQLLTRYGLDRLSLQYSLQYDSLTRVANKVLFMDRLTQMSELALRNKQRFGLLIVDIHGLSRINDQYGNSIGDEALKATAKTLLSCVRKSDTVARVRDDKFAIILANTWKEENLKHVIKKINFSFKPPYALKKFEEVIRLSMGVSIFIDNGETAEAILENAFVACAQAKKQTEDNFCFYT
jgi:diguanylate cyclase